MATAQVQLQQQFSNEDSSQQGYNQQYQFDAKPQPIKGKAKYREDQDLKNIMNQFDTKRKIVAHPQKQPPSQQQSKQQQQQQQQQQLEESLQGQNQEEQFDSMQDNIYEDLMDRRIDEENRIQIDFYIDKPPEPEFKPLPKGKDVGTQIKDTELFDFELEVEPVLQTIVGKTLEQSKMELIEEDEIQQMKFHKEKFSKLRNAELMVTQRMEAQYIRVMEQEAQRRRLQHEIQQKQSKEKQKKFDSRAITKKALQNVKDTILNELDQEGYLSLNIKQDIQKDYLPWLEDFVMKGLDKITNDEQNVENYTNWIEQELAQQHEQFLEKEKQRRTEIDNERKRIQAEKDARRAHKRERKRLKQLRDQRTEKMNKLYDTFLKNGKQVNEFILNEEIVDVNTNFNKQVVSSFGGLIGELWVFVQTIQNILSEQEKEQLSYQQILRFLTILLRQEQFKQKLNVELNQNIKEEIEENIRKMDDDLEAFNQLKEQVIDQILQLNEKLAINNNKTLYFIYQKNLLDYNNFKLIMKAILSAIFMSITYKEKPKPEEQQQGQDQIEEGGGNKDQVNKSILDKSVDKSLIEKSGERSMIQNKNDKSQMGDKSSMTDELGHVITQEDRDIVDAKQKLNIIYQNELDDFYLDRVYAIMRLRVPLDRDMPRRAVIQDQKQDNSILDVNKSQQSNIDDNVNKSMRSGRSQKDQMKDSQPIKDQQSQKGSQSGKQNQSMEKEKANQSMEKEKQEKQSQLSLEEQAHELSEIQQIAEAQQEEEKKAHEESFIEPYDGQTFENEREQWKEREISEVKCINYDLTKLQGQKVLIIDEIAQKLIRKILYQALSTSGIIKLDENQTFEQFLPLEAFYDKIYDVSKQIQWSYIHQLFENYEDIAVFDYEE